MDKAMILGTGEELITGKVVDTNSSYIADQLFSVGVEVVAILKFGDEKERLLWAFHHAAELGNLIIGTVGLGPTADDLTTETVAQFLGRPLDLHKDIAEALKHKFALHNDMMLTGTRDSNRFPRKSRVGSPVCHSNPVAKAQRHAG